MLVRTAPRGRDVAYELAPVRFEYPRAGLDEHEVGKAVAAAIQVWFELSSDDEAAILYALTEMVNNAIDHSEGRNVSVQASARGEWLEINVVDDGIGVFEGLRRRKDLPSIDDAVVQLEKGKLTTMPARHSGEVIFFTSKTAHRFRLESGARAWVVDNVVGDRTVEEVKPARKGTLVTLSFRPGHIEALENVFRKYTDEDNAFTKTRTTVRLAQAGTRLLSRSEAKRVVAGLEKFTHVTLDFAGVERVGQGFVDEVFRVFADAHPGIVLEPQHMNEAVTFMIGRAVPVDEAKLPPQFPARAEAFLEMAPARYLRALEMMAIEEKSAYQTVLVRGSAFFGLFMINELGDEEESFLASLFSGARRVSGLRAAWSAVQLAKRLDPIPDVEALSILTRLLLAESVLRIAKTPRTWRYFADDDGIRRFRQLEASQRVECWGEPIAIDAFE